tara:strand:+ start:7938 stop:8534 length:597 start_codon:yes stop_codon:yes gene_type:complete
MHLDDALNIFGSKVKADAKKELKRKGKSSTGSLSNSIDYDLDTGKNSFSLSFLMEDYGVYVDQGVHGIGGFKNKKDSQGKIVKDGQGNPVKEKWKKKKVFGSPFSYRNPSRTSSNGGFKLSLGGWTIKKGLAPRDAKGKFTSRKGMIFAIRKSIFHTGLETTHFFTKPFEKAFRELPEDITEAYALDVENLLEFTLRN